VSSEDLRDVRFDCAPNDAPAVTGRWTGPLPVTLTVVDRQGEAHDSMRASPGPFVLRLNSPGLPAGAEVQVEAREGEEVVDRVAIALRYGPAALVES
jgi:hypothetical protein